MLILTLWLGRFPGEGNGNPLQYSCLENPMDGGAWCRLLSMGSGGSDGKESSCNVGDQGSIPGLGRSPGEWKGYSLQYAGLENSMNHSPWGRTESDTTEYATK